MFLCGVDPPVLKLHKTDSGKSEYISVVEEVITPKDQVSLFKKDRTLCNYVAPALPNIHSSDWWSLLQSDNENTEERWSDPEDENEDTIDTELVNRDSVSSIDDKDLLHRKKELERIQQKREKYMRDKKVWRIALPQECSVRYVQLNVIIYSRKPLIKRWRRSALKWRLNRIT